MFGWRNKKKPASGLDPQIEKLFQRVMLLFDSEAFQNSRLPEELRKLVLSGLNCDRIPAARGEFGREATNPIPVNGPLGQVLYLSQLRTSTDSPMLFHRVGSRQVGEVSVDMYEVMSLDETVREHLYLSLYHPRRSRQCPSGYKIERKVDFGNPLYGVNFLVGEFPKELDRHIRDCQLRLVGFPLSINKVRTYLHGSTMPTSPSVPGPQPVKTGTWTGAKRDTSEGFGICFACSQIKKHFMMPCEHCGRRPEREEEAIYSLALSALFYDLDAIEVMSRALCSGQKTVVLDEVERDKLRPAASVFLDKINPLFRNT